MTWKSWLNATSTQETVTDVVQARARHWEKYRHARCPHDDCEQHPITVTDLLDQIDPDQGFMKGNRIR